ncbi:MAG: T9SS type A sorting domain-containing protein, partial [Fibromonadaceae bacterium]|nr:T9SS type A sorting domain-containing protein [Fibromonadaceae bacterium]
SYWDTTTTGITTSEGGEGKSTAEMTLESTFVNWDFTNIWRMSAMPGGSGYPVLAWQIEESTSISRDNVSRNTNLTPTATVRGKMLNVTALSQTANLQIRIVDMRGKTITRFTAIGGGNFSLDKISAGSYIVEIRDATSGQRFTSAVAVQ